VSIPLKELGTRSNNVRATENSTRAPLSHYREAVYGTCANYRQSLFEMTDALLTYPGPVCCPAHLSLETEVGHGALYRALAEGEINTAAVRLVQLDLFRDMDLAPVFSIDCTGIPRPDSPTSPERHMHHLSNRLGRLACWSYHVVVAQVPGHNSWNLPIEVTRVGLGSDKEHAALESMKVISEELGEHCIFILDAGYSSAQITFLARKMNLDVTIIVRLSSYQVLYEGQVIGARGKELAYGPRFELKKAGSRRGPDATFSWDEPYYGAVEVNHTAPLRMRALREKSPWLGPKYVDGQHVPTPKTDGDVLEVRVARLPGSSKGGNLWLWCSTPLAGATLEEIQAVVRAYFHRLML